jgi:transposase
LEFLQYLLPSQDHLHLKQWELDHSTNHLTLTVSSIQTVTACPLCQTPTQRIHSHYERRLQDLPCVQFGVTLLLQVRKFFCVNDACKRRLFTERLPQVTVPWARRTCRLADRLIAIGLALGGAAGERLSYRLGYGIRDSTLLYLLAQLPLPAIVVPQTLGVDDFAFRKRQSYGTILVDLDQKSRPIGLLAGREAETLAEWLKQHPGIEVLSRDRAAGYRSGMSQGAPDAVQVADRFHLLQNLAKVLEQTLGTHLQALKAVDTAQRLTGVDHATEAVVVLPPTTASLPKVKQLAQQRRVQRVKTYETVRDLHQQGWSLGAIAQKVGVSTRTVQRYLHTASFPERQERSDRGRSLLSPYKPYLLEQYNEGRRRVKTLFWDIQKQGYTGSYMTVVRYIRQLAQAQGVELRRYPTGRQLPKVVDPQRPTLTARRAAFLVLRHPETLETDEQQVIERLVKQPELATAVELAQGFIHLVRQRQPEQLDIWLEQAKESHLAPMVRFAQSLREDYDAVRAGVTLSTSNGPVEGQINRLKMLKRQMYGRAGIDLLSRRFLLAS